jgi:hypothetical protein
MHSQIVASVELTLTCTQRKRGWRERAGDVAERIAHHRSFHYRDIRSVLLESRLELQSKCSAQENYYLARIYFDPVISCISMV